MAEPCHRCGGTGAHLGPVGCSRCVGLAVNESKALWDYVERPKNKYTRHVKGADIDVYDVLRAWDVTCPAIQHAVKKLLAPGQRGHKDRITDLREALVSVQRGIEMEEGK